MIDLPIANVFADASPCDAAVPCPAGFRGVVEPPPDNSYLYNQAIIDVVQQIGDVTREFCSSAGPGDDCPQGVASSIHDSFLSGANAKRVKNARHRRLWKVAQVNITSWTAGVHLLEDGADADVYLFQELKRNSDQWPYIISQANRIGFHMAAHPSIITDKGGLSAGVGIASPWAHGLGIINYPMQSDNPVESRFILRHLSGILKQGVVTGSIYCHTGVGDGQLNMDLLRRACGVLRGIGLPFVLGGDFQMSPQMLAEAGIPGMFRAQIFNPSCDTFVSGDVASEIDYFLVSNDLAPFVISCSARFVTCVANHAVVELVLDTIDRTKCIQVIRKPKRLPLKEPVGCPPLSS